METFNKTLFFACFILLVFWFAFIFARYICCYWLASRNPSHFPETTPTTDAAAQSLDDDWADIALALEKENRNV